MDATTSTAFTTSITAATIYLTSGDRDLANPERDAQQEMRTQNPEKRKRTGEKDWSRFERLLFHIFQEKNFTFRVLFARVKPTDKTKEGGYDNSFAEVCNPAGSQNEKESYDNCWNRSQVS